VKSRSRASRAFGRREDWKRPPLARSRKVLTPPYRGSGTGLELAEARQARILSRTTAGLRSCPWTCKTAQIPTQKLTARRDENVSYF